MQPKLLEILGLVEEKGDVGLEIEVEGRNLHEVRNAFWKCEDDGSLRGHYPETRCEYILKKPVPIDKVAACVRNLNEQLEGAKFDFSFRTSVHVHVNVQQLNIDQILNMIYTYLLIEEPLVNYCGKTRKGNQFALRLVDAEGLIGGLAELFSNGNLRWERDQYRYAGLNIEALTKYGSLEFRGMRGTIDVDVINTWASTLINLREYATKQDNPMAIYEEYVKLGPRKFFRNVVGEYSKAYEYPRMMAEIQRNFSLTLDLPHMFKRQLEERKKPKPKVVKNGLGYMVTQREAIDLINRLGEGWDGRMFKLRGDGKYEIVKVPAPRKENLFQPIPVEEWDAEPAEREERDEW